MASARLTAPAKPVSQALGAKLPVSRQTGQIQLFFTYRCNMSLVRSPHLHRTDVFEPAAPHGRHDMAEYQPESSYVLG